MPLIRSILFLMEKLIKLVSIRTRYGGPSCVLYLKNREDGVLSLQAEEGAGGRVDRSGGGSGFERLGQFAGEQAGGQ